QLGWRLAMLPIQWLTSIGVMLPAGVLGMTMLARRNGLVHEKWLPLIATATACLGYVLSQALLEPSRLRIDAELKLSFLLAIGLVPAAAYAAAHLPRGVRRPLFIAAVPLAALGLPSVVHDTIWHSCQTPACVGEGGRSTTIPHADYE